MCFVCVWVNFLLPCCEEGLWFSSFFLSSMFIGNKMVYLSSNSNISSGSPSLINVSKPCRVIFFFFFQFIENRKEGYKEATGSSIKHSGTSCVKVPKIYWDLTSKTVLTMEWIDGIKLTDEVGLKEASLNRKELIDQVLSLMCHSIIYFLLWFFN